MSRAAVSPSQAYRWVDTDAEFGCGHRSTRRRAALRARHRVPPRTHLLPEAGAAAVGVAGRAGARRPVGRRRAGTRTALRVRCAGSPPRVATGPRRAHARRPMRAATTVRHPGRRWFRRLRNTVAGGPAAGRARRQPGQRRPAHRLAAPPADRRSMRVRGGRCGLPARSARPPHRAARRARPARVGRRRVCRVVDQVDRAVRSRRRVDEAEGRSFAAPTGSCRGPGGRRVARAAGDVDRHPGPSRAARSGDPRHRPAATDRRARSRPGQGRRRALQPGRDRGRDPEGGRATVWRPSRRSPGRGSRTSNASCVRP